MPWRRPTLESPSRSQRELRELQRWVVAPTLRQVTGVADITNFGGETTQFQLILDPARLIQYGVSLKDVTEAITNNNSNAGGSMLVRGDQGFVVRGIGLIRNLEDLGNIVVSEQHGTPVFLRSLGALQLGALQRNGILGKDGNPDGVSGIVLLLRGENPSRVLDGLHERVAALNHGLLPADVKVVPYLDRTDLVRTTLNTVSHTMIEGIGLVIIVLILFLGSPRSALIVATVIPLSLLIAFILMRMTNIPANLLSLGAIDFGIIVDGAIVVMESILRRREERPQDEMTEGDAISATSLVARPIFFAKIIIPIVLVLIFILLYGAFGVAVQNGVILVSGLHELRKTGMPLAEAVAVGATQRLRAVVLTAMVAALGMLPAALADGIGSDVQRPLATVVVGGLVSATLLTLFVLPALYDVIEMSNSSELPPVDSNSNVDTFAGLVESEESPPIPAAPLSEVAHEPLGLRDNPAVADSCFGVEGRAGAEADFDGVSASRDPRELGSGGSALSSSARQGTGRGRQGISGPDAHRGSGAARCLRTIGTADDYARGYASDRAGRKAERTRCGGRSRGVGG